jgi:hypothetical protein
MKPLNLPATIKQGPYGLLRIETDKGAVLVNGNGMFDVQGHKISAAKSLVILDPK